MRRSLTERKLRDTAKQLKRLRADQAVVNEQLIHFAEEAEDARLRSLVSETAIAGREHRDADRHAEALQRQKAHMAAEIDRLEALQDELLDRLSAGG